MKRMQLVLAAGLLLASPLAPAAVSDAEFQALKDAVATLSRKLADVEQQLAVEKARNAPAETAPAAVADAATTPAGATPPPQPAAASWTDKVSLQGDFRFRHDSIDQEGKVDRNRERIRARLALTARPHENLEIGFGLSTRPNADPASGNQTLGGGASGKDIYLDLAYFNWTARPGLDISGGKIHNNQYRPGGNGLIWDADLRPEGFGLNYRSGAFFANLLGSWLESDSDRTEAFGVGGQLGVAWALGDRVKLTAGAGYFDINSAGKGAFYVVAGKPAQYYGNSIDAAGRYLYDYRELEGFADLSFEFLDLPASVFFDYVRNLDADRLDSGWAAGMQAGAAKARGNWQLSYVYQDLERDAVFGLWTDSSFGGGSTDAKGHVLRGAYALTDRTRMGIAYYLNEIGMNQGRKTDYDRLQLDLDFRY